MSTATPAIEYPETDGQPMADNSLQYRWIVTIHGNLEVMFRDRDDVFVAADNLIYAVEGSPRVRAAPDVYVAFGRPKGDRGSYRVWEEGGIFPQVIFEVWSPGNRAGEMGRKFSFYDRYGAEEYYIIDPDRNLIEGYTRGPFGLDEVEEMNGFRSPRLGIRFETTSDEPVLYRPDDKRFLTFLEVAAEARRADAEAQRADAERQRAETYAARLRAAGIDPDAHG
jgi:Uma2 family endonuclease